eukprot:gene14579-14703_t
MPAPLDLVYLNNFSEAHRPKPYSLPAGLGVILKEKTKDLIKNIKVILNKMTTNPHYLRQIDSLSASLDYQIEQQITEIKHYAYERGYEVSQTPDGFNVEPLKDVNFENDKNGGSNLQDALIQKFQEEFGIYLGEWIDELKADILKHIDDFLDDEIEEGAKLPFNLEEWYSVNLFVDHRFSKHPKVILEAHPTYENLFGSIKYRASAAGAVETNFTMIRPGAFHMANGGILVLRAEALAQDPELWEFIKGDKFGRKNALFYSMLLMSVPTFLIGLLPTYESIGILASILLILIRLLQGLAMGGEYAGTMTYLVEGAGLKNKGFYGSVAALSLVMDQKSFDLLAECIRLYQLKRDILGKLFSRPWQLENRAENLLEAPVTLNYYAKPHSQDIGYR